jgi:hypothetical protein
MSDAATLPNGRAQEAPASVPANGQPTSLVQVVEHEALGTGPGEHQRGTS